MTKGALITNQLKCDISYDKFRNKYSVVKIISDKDIKPSLYFLDEALESNSVLSVCYTEKSDVFLLINNGPSSIVDIRKAVDKYDFLSVKSIEPEELNLNVIIQLLINSLARGRLKEFSFNNLSGHFFVVVPDKINNKHIVTVEVRVDNNCCVQLPVRTFTSELLQKKIEFKKGRTFSSYPMYVVTANGSLKRVYKKEKDQLTYINRQEKGKKSTVDFFNFRSLDSFNKTKTGILNSVMTRIGRIYKDIISLDFVSVEDYTTEEHPALMTKNEKERLNILAENYKYRVIDFVKDDVSKEVCAYIVDSLSKKGLLVTEGKYLKTDSCNICIIHNDEYYQEGEDPHDKLAGYDNQCITVETYLNNRKELDNAINTIIHELMIKNDLKTGIISIFDWGSCLFEKNWIFIAKDEDRFIAMTIRPTGEFNIDVLEQNLFSYGCFSKYADIFISDKNVIALVEDDQGNINAIQNTEMFTLPALKSVEEELRLGNNKLKNKEKREWLMPSILDINYFKKDGQYYYCVGKTQDGIIYTANNASLIRKIVAIGDSKMIFESILELMNVLFVRNGQLTVIPFPFKYINEFDIA